MKCFTGFEYLLIDCANNFHTGLDKLPFEVRIAWATAHLAGLEDLANGAIWKERPLYLKAVQAIRKAQQGIPTGHIVGMDAICSGMQIMSAITGCETGAAATGLIDPDRRANAYSDITQHMLGHIDITIPDLGSRVKDATIAAMYGSKAEPRNLFGEDTPELAAYQKALFAIAPGACDLLQVAMDSWQPYALAHEWQLPDGGVARVKVMQTEECRIEVDELNHSTFTYQYSVNQGEKSGVKNAANIVHSVDAYILRCMIRRCSYDLEVTRMAQDLISYELMARSADWVPTLHPDYSVKVGYYMERYFSTKMVDPVILDHLTAEDIRILPTAYLRKLNVLLCSMLEHRPFDLVTIHDQFGAHANHMNHVRKHYRDILAELAESEILSDIFNTIHGTTGIQYQKMSPDLGSKIRKSNYGLS